MSNKMLILLLGFCVSGGSYAADKEPGGAFSLTVENDVFTSSDNNYTNGIGFSWVSNAVDTGGTSGAARWTRFWSFLPFVADEGYRTYASWGFTHEMNTPDDISIPNPSEYDQPYSGLAYVDSALYAHKRHWTHAWQLRLGMVGPAAQGDSAQREFHKLIGADRPQGWHTQLPDEPIFNIDYTVAHRIASGRIGDMAEWRLVPVATVGVGNYFTGAGLGMYGEIGWNLVDALGAVALRSGLNAASTVGVGPQNRWSISLFSGAAAYGVAHYLPLDGTLFRNSRSVDSESTLAMYSFGFCLRRNNFTLSFAQTDFRDTFHAQHEGTDFGTLGVSWFF